MKSGKSRNPCYDENEDHYHHCRNQQRVQLLLCQEDCGAFNPICEHECYETYEDNLTNCPCGEKCSNGCPCPSISTYDCYDDDDLPNVDIVPGLLKYEGPDLNGDCYLNRWNAPSVDSSTKDTVYHDYIAHYYRGPYASIESCVNQCKKVGRHAYAALENGGRCYCGNMPPKEEKYAECRVPCNNALDEYCGGTEGQASWFMSGNEFESELKKMLMVSQFSSRNDGGLICQ